MGELSGIGKQKERGMFISSTRSLVVVFGRCTQYILVLWGQSLFHGSTFSEACFYIAPFPLHQA